jgi:DNA-directed RNA polymerase delta subunit
LLSPHCQPLLLFFDFYFKKEIDFWGITQNWVMTMKMLVLLLILLGKIQEHKKKNSEKIRNLIGNFYINDF